MPSRLADCLLRDRTLRTEVVQTAVARKEVYGGALDTALLELDALDEPTLWEALAAATELPVPEAELLESPDPEAASLFDAAWSRRCHAVPVGQREGALQLLCGEPVDHGALAAARVALAATFELHVVPEVRLAAARQAVYGERMPPRLLRLLARLLGAQPVRLWTAALNARDAPAPQGEQGAEIPGESVPTPVDAELAQAAAPAPAPEAAPAPSASALGATVPVTSDAIGEGGNHHAPPPAAAGAPADPVADVEETAGRIGAAIDPVIETSRPQEPLEERLCRIAEDATAEGWLEALRALRVRLSHPRVQVLTEKMRADLAGPDDAAVRAATAIAELCDPEAIPALIATLGGSEALARLAHRALVEIAKQDFGVSRRRWGAWWDRHQGEDRIEWLFEGLSHKTPEIRFSSSEELRLLTGEYFGYHYDLPKRDREEASARWRAWWRDAGKGKSPS